MLKTIIQIWIVDCISYVFTIIKKDEKLITE
jgi:hypothetical protein